MRKNLPNINSIDLFLVLLSSLSYVVIITIPVYAIQNTQSYGEAVGANNVTIPFTLVIIFTLILCTILILKKMKIIGYKMKLKAISMKILKVIIFNMIIILPVSYLVNSYNTYQREIFDLVTHVEGEAPPYISPFSAKAIVTIFIMFFCSTLALRKMGEKAEWEL